MTDIETFEGAVASRQEFKARIQKLQDAVRQYDQYLWATLERWGEKKRTAGEWTVSRRDGTAPRKHIDPNKLLELGVPAHVIQAATIVGEKGRPRVTIRQAGKDEEPDPFTEWVLEVRAEHGE